MFGEHVWGAGWGSTLGEARLGSTFGSRALDTPDLAFFSGLKSSLKCGQCHASRTLTIAAVRHLEAYRFSLVRIIEPDIEGRATVCGILASTMIVERAPPDGYALPWVPNATSLQAMKLSSMAATFFLLRSLAVGINYLFKELL